MLARRLFSHLDRSLLVIVGVILLLGLTAIYSATRAQPALTGGDPFYFVKRQLLWLLLGGLGLLLVFLVDYEVLTRLHPFIYCFCLLLLVLVLKFGSGRGGAVSWFALGPVRFQPSEPAKLALVLSLSAFLSHRSEWLGRFRLLFSSFLVVAAPAALVFVQPDFGSAVVLLAIWLGVSLGAGVRIRQLLLLLLGCALLFAGAWRLDLLRPHQKHRLISFLRPGADPLGAGYQRLQSRIAVGSGELLGKGLFRGTQAQLRFLPEQHTDFVFALIAEEMGLLGAGFLLLLYFLLLWRALRIARHARDQLGGLLALGVFSLLGFHVFVNIGIATGLFPITGLPLPFVSYGGSNLVVNLLAVGLLLNISARRHKVIF
jgi:rod shape determining protein RodA